MSKLDQYTDLYGGGDPSVEGRGGDFKTFPDGEYKVNGIAKFFSVDDNDPPLPVFVPGMNGSMVARLNLRLVELVDGSNVGPSFSGTRAELAAVGTALGADVSKLPQGETTAFLLALEKAVNEAAGVQLAKVRGGKGWARYIDGATPPEETFLWKLVGFRGLDRKELTFQLKKEEWNGKTIEKEVILIQFAVAGKANGQPSPYNDYQIEVELRKPFAEGYRYKADGKPIWMAVQGKNGGLLPSVKDFFTWLDIFWPDHFNWDWQEDPEKSPYGTNEVENPIMVIAGEALKAGKTAHAKLSMTKNGRPYLRLDDFSKSGLDEEVKDAPSDSVELYNLVQMIEKTSGMQVFEPTETGSALINVTLTTEGKTWAKRVLGELCNTLKYPRNLRDMTPAQLVDMTKHVEAVGAKSDEEIKQYCLNLEHDEAF